MPTPLSPILEEDEEEEENDQETNGKTQTNTQHHAEEHHNGDVPTRSQRGPTVKFHPALEHLYLVNQPTWRRLNIEDIGISITPNSPKLPLSSMPFMDDGLTEPPCTSFQVFVWSAREMYELRPPAGEERSVKVKDVVNKYIELYNSSRRPYVDTVTYRIVWDRGDGRLLLSV